MALPSNTTISISQIKTELVSSNNSLMALSALAGKSSPDAMSEFWGYTNASFTYLSGVFGSGTGNSSSTPFTTTFQMYGDGGSSSSQYVRMNGPGSTQRVQVYSPSLGLIDSVYVFQGTYPSGPFTYRGQAYPNFALDLTLSLGRDLLIYADVQRGDENTIYNKISYLYTYSD